MDSNGLDPQFSTGPDDSTSYFTAIGDQYFFEHMSDFVTKPGFEAVHSELCALPEPSANLLFLDLQSKERLPVLNRLPVLDKYLRHGPHGIRLNIVHQLHRLDDAERLSNFDRIP